MISLTIAKEFYENGLSPIPFSLTSTVKKPAVQSWNRDEKATEELVDAWFSKSHKAIGIVCGTPSGNVEVIDIDTKNIPKEWKWDLFSEYSSEVKKMPGLYEKLYIEKTLRGGYHFIYKADNIEGNKKLAYVEINKQPECVIETRGQGGLVVVAPSLGYHMVQGDIKALPTLSNEERNHMIYCAKLFTRIANEVSGPAITYDESHAFSDTRKAFEDFNKRGDLLHFLVKAGWTVEGKDSRGTIRLIRPGKDSGTSATLGYRNFYVFSSNASPFKGEKSYTNAMAYALLEHNGDLNKATKALRHLGYGGEIPKLQASNYLRGMYTVRYNAISGKIDMKKHQEPEFQSIDEQLYHRLSMDIARDVFVDVAPSTVRTLLLDLAVKTDPFAEYFNALKWDGKDHIKALADTIVLENPNEEVTLGGKKITENEFKEEALKRWLVSLVATATDPGIQNQMILTFISKQARRKSRWVRGLLPKDNWDQYMTTINGFDIASRDNKLLLSNKLILLFDELSTKHDIDALKSLTTMDTVSIRKAYRIDEETYVRRASFIATLNDNEFLTDPTGTRRWIVLKLDQMVFPHQVDMDGVYAQAMSLYKQGYPFYFDMSESDEITERNQQYRQQSIEWMLINKHFAVEGASVFYTATEIMNIINEEDKTRLSPVHIGRALNEMKVETKMTRGVRQYKLKRISTASMVGVYKMKGA